MTTAARIANTKFALEHQLPEHATSLIMIMGVDYHCPSLHIDDTAVAREIIAATRRIIAAHLALLESEQAATERAHA